MTTIQFSDRKVSYDTFIRDITASIVKQLKGKDVEPDVVSTEEAARILGITPDRLRRIKDRFSYSKAGGSSQGKLLFKRSTLIKAYLK